MKQRCKECGRIRKKAHEQKMPCGKGIKAARYFDIPFSNLIRTITMKLRIGGKKSSKK